MTGGHDRRPMRQVQAREQQSRSTRDHRAHPRHIRKVGGSARSWRPRAVHLPVLVVDDGSTDDTAAQAEIAGADVIRQVPNQGKGAALRAGFRRALDAGAEPWSPSTRTANTTLRDPVVPRRVSRPIRPELIIGEATSPDAAGAAPRRTRSVALVLLRGCRPAHPGQPVRYRLIGRGLMRALLDSKESGFEFEVEMIARCIALGLPIAWVPIRTIYDGEPSHIRARQHLANFLRVSRDARRIVRRG